jgi:hypothetical protein
LSVAVFPTTIIPFELSAVSDQPPLFYSTHHPFVPLTRDTEFTEIDILFDLARDAAKSKSSAPPCGAEMYHFASPLDNK